MGCLEELESEFLDFFFRFFSRVLTDLNLFDNNIRDEGAAAIADALKGNGVLTKLGLFDNSIGPTGATALADALRRISPLLAHRRTLAACSPLLCSPLLCSLLLCSPSPRRAASFR